MTREEKSSLAQALLNNPLFDVVFDKLEHDAIEQCINAPIKDSETRDFAAAEVRAIRSFRRNCRSMIDNNLLKKAAPV